MDRGRGLVRGRVALTLVAGALAVSVAGIAAVVVTPRAGAKAGGPGVASAPIRIGVVLPLNGATAALAGQELLGIRIAADLVNKVGGVNGRRIRLDVRNLGSALDAAPAMASLRADGAVAVIGAYSPTSRSRRVLPPTPRGSSTGRAARSPTKSRDAACPSSSASGRAARTSAATRRGFAATQLAPRLGVAASALRVAIGLRQGRVPHVRRRCHGPHRDGPGHARR